MVNHITSAINCQAEKEFSSMGVIFLAALVAPHPNPPPRRGEGVIASEAKQSHSPALSQDWEVKILSIHCYNADICR